MNHSTNDSILIDCNQSVEVIQNMHDYILCKQFTIDVKNHKYNNDALWMCI